MVEQLNRLEIEIMSEIKTAGRARVTPTDENMNCAATLCDRGLMKCDKINGRAFYSLTDDGHKALEAQKPMKAGDKVSWLYTARTGWNPSWWVPATVVKVTAKRVTIETEKLDGSFNRRVSVKPEKLKMRETVQS